MISAHCRHLADREYPATAGGYRKVASWPRLDTFGSVAAVGIGGTSAYGAELAHHLAESDLTFIGVDRPDRKARRMSSMTDPIDTCAAAIAVASGRATGTPKTHDGKVEAVRALPVPRLAEDKTRAGTPHYRCRWIAKKPSEVRRDHGCAKALLGAFWRSA